MAREVGMRWGAMLRRDGTIKAMAHGNWHVFKPGPAWVITRMYPAAKTLKRHRDAAKYGEPMPAGREGEKQ
jgi:hypothetical protein